MQYDKQQPFIFELPKSPSLQETISLSKIFSNFSFWEIILPSVLCVGKTEWQWLNDALQAFGRILSLRFVLFYALDWYICQEIFSFHKKARYHTAFLEHIVVRSQQHTLYLRKAVWMVAAARNSCCCSPSEMDAHQRQEQQFRNYVHMEDAKELRQLLPVISPWMRQTKSY